MRRPVSRELIHISLSLLVMNAVTLLFINSRHQRSYNVYFEKEFEIFFMYDGTIFYSFATCKDKTLFLTSIYLSFSCVFLKALVIYARSKVLRSL